MSKDWRRAIIGPDSSIRDAMATIEDVSLKIALVAGPDDQLLGVVTDGDIWRGLLRKIDLSSSVQTVMNSSPVYATPADSPSKIRKILEERVLLHMPVLDNGKLVDLITWDQVHSRRRHANPVVLMAGGFGTRLRPLTDKIPKPLLKVGDKPILESIIERFIDGGFHQFFITLHYLPELVMEHFEDGAGFGVDITYMHETDPLGTAGALSMLPHQLLPDLPIIVMNGDLLTRVDFEQLLLFHREQSASATMCVRQYQFEVPYGVVTADGGKVTNIVEKPSQTFFVNAGIYVLNKEVVSRVPEGMPLDMPALLVEEVRRGNTVAMFPIHEYWLDIGRKEDFERAQREYLKDWDCE